jgi:TRAP-type mannitol/chloroaromatic compound transport system substrate-binding protein
LKDKVKLIYVPGWHQPETVFELIINKDRWEALSDYQRGLIKGACLATLQATLTDSPRLQAEALADLAKGGVRVEEWPAAVLSSLRAAWSEIAKDEGERDYFFKEVLDDIEKFRTKAASGPEAPPAAVARPAPNVSAEKTPTP